MSTTLNQSAPAAQAPASKDFIKFEVFPKSDSYVLTCVGYNYHPDYPFKRTDEKTKEEYIKNGPGLEFFWGAIVNGVAYFCKTWPQSYSLNEKANYYKWYEAGVGKPPIAGTKADDMVGKFYLGVVKVEDKKSAKGTAYRVSTLKGVGPVPSILASAGTPLKDLLPAFEAALAKKDEKEVAPF